MKILIYFITLFIFSTFAFACDNKNSDINFNKENKENNMNNDNMPNNPKYAYFSSGCFWGVEYWFEKAAAKGEQRAIDMLKQNFS